MFGKRQESAPPRFNFEVTEAPSPPGTPTVLVRAAAMLLGGLMAAVVFIQAAAFVPDVARTGDVTAAAILYGAALTLGLILALYTYALGYSAFDSKKALRLTAKVLLWFAIAAAVIALIALAGGFGWSSGDSDSEGDSSGDSPNDHPEGGSRWLSILDSSSWSWSGVQGDASRQGESRAAACMSCGMPVMGYGRICGACSYRETYPSARW